MTPTANTVQGVLGPMASTTLGYSLIHEHMVSSLRCYWAPDEDPEVAFKPVALASLSDVRSNPFSCRDNLDLDRPNLLIEELRRFHAVGGRSVVEVSSHGMGRDLRSLAWVATTSGVNIVAGCGYYIRKSHPTGLSDRSAESFADEILAELNGANSEKIRAGVIGELGVGSFPMDPTEARVLQGAAKAQQQADVGMIVHSAPGSESPFEIADTLESAGANMSRVVISHLDERFRSDVNKYVDLARRGVGLGLDTFGREVYLSSRHRQHPSDEQRIETVRQLLDAGLAAQILLSQDICLKHELSAFGGHGYSHILGRIVPRMIKSGISQESIDVMLRDNVAHVLCG